MMRNNPASPPTTGVPGAEPLWQPIETAPHGRKLIVGYPNALGNWRSVMARYFGPETLRLTDEEGYAPEGWYEECESNPDDQIYRTDEAPTHWMPLAPAPGASPPTTGEADLLREPLGEQIFGLWFKNMSLEDELFAGLEAAGMPDGYNDFWTDHYDASIEFGFVEQGFVMPQSALDHLWSIGFSRCWVNYDKEHALYFSKDIPAPGVNHNAHGSKVADGAERKRLRASIESLSSRLDMTQRDFEHSTRWRSKAYNEQAEKLDQANAANASLRDKLAERDADAERYRLLREPTKAMVDAGYVQVFRYTNGSNHLMSGGLEAAWRAMYDAARQSAQAASQPSNPET